MTKQSPPHRPKEAERGAVLVQTLLILPIFVLIVFGSYTVWKVVSVKQSLHSGTYQATRYLCLNPVDPLVPEIWEAVVEEIVSREVRNNGMAGGAQPAVRVTFFGDKLDCGLRFRVEASVGLQIDIPYVSVPTVTLSDRHEGWVECS